MNISARNVIGMDFCGNLWKKGIMVHVLHVDQRQKGRILLWGYPILRVQLWIIMGIIMVREFMIKGWEKSFVPGSIVRK